MTPTRTSFQNQYGNPKHANNNPASPKKETKMNPLTQFKKISILPLLVALTLLVRAAPAAAQANEVTNWNRIATDTLVAFPPAAGGAAPALYINVGMTQGAVYDALNAFETRY